ncbi:putative 5-formyltetrahydrofolate cyclo-ligase [compost metagenome]
MNIRDRKIELRKQIEHQRSLLSLSDRENKQQRINDALIQLCKDHGSVTTLLTYMPFRSEPDITPLMEWCWSEGIRVLVPRVVPETRSMVLHQVDEYLALDSGAYGIREPRTDMPVERDLISISMIVIPGLAFDHQFGRLGYGGGYYDRFMQLFASRGLEKPPAIAAAFDLQMVPEIPTSWHDFRVDGIVTESLLLYRER